VTTTALSSAAVTSASNFAQLGGRPSLVAALAALGRPELTIARVASDLGEQLCLVGARARLARPSGRLRRSAGELERPVVGDWVAIRDGAHPDEPAVIHHVLPRHTLLVRRAAGRREGSQAVAANVDTYLVVTSANRDANPRRVERYLAAVWSSGARPLLVVNKCDLVSEAALAAICAQLTRCAPGVPVHRVSASTGAGFAELIAAALPAPGAAIADTVAFVGMSGVGKSSLINRLLPAAGHDAQRTLPIDQDDRGRHATTRRDLFVLPSGGVVLDTPGMRIFGLVEDDGGLATSFAELAPLAGHCRFADCQHRSEPGCAIGAAVARGELDAERVAALHKLEREVSRAESRRDPAAAALAKRRTKALHQAQRARSKVDPKLRE
jgi:ribosome biogenesis GTPase / thiamine phosphate phosphatase